MVQMSTQYVPTKDWWNQPRASRQESCRKSAHIKMDTTVTLHGPLLLSSTSKKLLPALTSFSKTTEADPAIYQNQLHILSDALTNISALNSDWDPVWTPSDSSSGLPNGHREMEAALTSCQNILAGLQEVLTDDYGGALKGVDGRQHQTKRKITALYALQRRMIENINNLSLIAHFLECKEYDLNVL